MAYFLDTVIPDNAVFLFFSKAEQFGLFGTMTPVKGYVNKKTGKPVAPYTGLRRRKLSHPISGNLFGHAADAVASSHIQTEKVKKPRKPSPEKLEAVRAKVRQIIAHAKVDALHAPNYGIAHRKLYLGKLANLTGLPGDELMAAQEEVGALFMPKTLTAEPPQGNGDDGGGGKGNGGGKDDPPESLNYSSSEIPADKNNAHAYRVAAHAMAQPRYANKPPVPITVSATQEEIQVSWRGIKHVLRDGQPSWQESLAALHVEELLQRAKKIGVEPDRLGRKDPIAVHRYQTTAKFDGNSHQVTLVVREHTDGKRYYDHSIIETKTPVGLPVSSVEKTAPEPAPPFAGAVNTLPPPVPQGKAAPPAPEGNGSGKGNGGSDGSGDKPPRRFKVTAERKGKEVKFTVEDAFFDWLQVKPYAIWADIDRLHLKHPDHFASAEAVQQHIQDVLAGAEIAMPATHVEYTLLVALRDHEDHQAATIEFVLRGGKYRVRNAQKMPQTQLDVKLDRAGVEARLRRGKRNPTVPPRNPTTPGISAGSPVPPSDGPPTKPEFTLPPPAPQSKAAPAPAEPQNANARHTLPLKSVLAEWKPRFRDSTPPRYRRVPKDILPKVYHVSGDLDMISLQASVTFMGDPDKNRDKARQILDAVKAAKEAGYEQKRVDIGGGNTALIFVKDEHVLTPAGVAGLRSDVFARPDLDDNAGYDAMAKNQTAVATAFARWMKTLPASTLDSFSALSAKISGTAIGQWAKIRRDQHGQPVLDVFGENGNVRARLTTGGMGSAGNPLYIQGANKDVKALLHHVIALANELKNSPPPTNEREWGRLTDRAEKKAAEAYKSGESLTDALREQSDITKSWPFPKGARFLFYRAAS